VGSFLSDRYIGGIEKKLLKGQSEMILDIRHEYHQTGMVVEALERAADRSKPFIAAHARKIASILNAVDPEDELKQYYDVAPNRYMKLLAGISHSIYEKGDPGLQNGDESLYLLGLSNIREEIHMDLYRRNRLDHILSGLVFVSVFPIFMLDPLRNWAESNFAIISNYYNSAWGLYTLFVLYAIFFGTFFTLRLLKGVDRNTQSIKNEGKILQRIQRYKWVNWIVDRVSPGYHEPQYLKATELLKESNSRLQVKDFYLQKIIFAVAAFFITTILQFYVHAEVRQNLMYPNEEIITGGGQSSSQKLLSQERYAFETSMMGEIIEKKIPPEQVVPFVMERVQGKYFMPSDLDIQKYADQFAERVQSYRNQYYKWYELVIAIFITVGSYLIPNGYMRLKKTFSYWEMQNEVDGFYNIVMILSRIERITVYEILEWIHQYSYIFEKQLNRCLIDYEAGAWQALENLKDEARFVPLERLADRLQVASELIPIKKAFEDLRQERAFAMDERRLYYEKMLTNRKAIAEFIGLIPLGATVFLYLLIPFVYLAFEQLRDMIIITDSM
jgi:hypothetical protein